jgi:hypothetical protein
MSSGSIICPSFSLREWCLVVAPGLSPHHFSRHPLPQDLHIGHSGITGALETSDAVICLPKQFAAALAARPSHFAPSLLLTTHLHIISFLHHTLQTRQPYHLTETGSIIFNNPTRTATPSFSNAT